MLVGLSDFAMGLGRDGLHAGAIQGVPVGRLVGVPWVGPLAGRCSVVG